MKQKYYLALSIEEWRLMLAALNTFRNRRMNDIRNRAFEVVLTDFIQG